MWCEAAIVTKKIKRKNFPFPLYVENACRGQVFRITLPNYANMMMMMMESVNHWPAGRNYVFAEMDACNVDPFLQYFSSVCISAMFLFTLNFIDKRPVFGWFDEFMGTLLAFEWCQINLLKGKIGREKAKILVDTNYGCLVFI